MKPSLNLNGRYIEHFINSLPNYIDNEGKEVIKQDVKDIVIKAFSTNNKTTVPRILAIGEVQSGKTNSIVGVTSLLLDNECHVVIIFGGVNQLLLSQTIERVMKPFISSKYAGVLIYDKHEISDEKNISSIASIINHQKSKVIILTLKEQKNTSNLVKMFENLYLKEVNIAIIDDEADNASINVGFKGKDSAIYKSISLLVNRIQNGAYIGVTATPYANLLNSRSNDLYPDKISIIRPGKRYTGLKFFNHEMNSIYTSIPSQKSFKSTWYDSIAKGISIFMVNSYIYKSKYESNQGFELLINIDLSIESFVDIHMLVKRFMNKVNQRIRGKDYLSQIQSLSDIVDLMKIQNIWDDSMYEGLRNHIINILSNIEDSVTILAAEENKYESGLKEFSIVIGGSLISRGFTFKDLLVEVILNAPQDKITADTLLQRARWFGYREEKNRCNYMKILMAPTIYDSFFELERLHDELYDYIKNVDIGKCELSPQSAKEAFTQSELIVPTGK